MRKLMILLVAILFSFSSLFAQDSASKSELESLKRDVDSLKNELEILKLKKDMDKLQSELDSMKSSTPKSDTPVSTPSVSNITAAPIYPFKKKILTINSYSGFASIAASLADNMYSIGKGNISVGDYNMHVIPGSVSLDYYGVNLTSEYLIKTNISLTFEYGWNGGSVYFADSSKSELQADFNIIPLAVGFKIYAKKFSPYGFFMNPKIGATIIQASGSIITRDQYETSSYRSHSSSTSYCQGNGADFNSDDFYYDSALSSETNSININFDYGIYAGVEFGFRIPLFRKALSKKKLELGIDVSLLDIGYYIKPYHENTVEQLSKMPILGWMGNSDYDNYYRWRILPLSKIGFTFRF